MKTVICIGDSITEGIGASSPCYSYVSQLQVLLGSEYNVCNFGRNAATLCPPPWGGKDNYRILDHFVRAKAEAKAAYNRNDDVIVSIMLGTNDADICDYGFEPDEEKFDKVMHDLFIKEYFVIIDSMLKEAPNSRFIICKSPYSYDSVKHKNLGNLKTVWNYQEEIAQMCADRHIGYIVNDMSNATKLEVIGKEGPSIYYRDWLHPNDVGHMYFAHFFYKAVKLLEKNIL